MRSRTADSGSASPRSRLLSDRAVILLIAVSGALHIDGLADTADSALFSARPRDQILTIMKDSRSGPMGVVAIVRVVILKIALIASVAGPVCWWGPPFDAARRAVRLSRSFRAAPLRSACKGLSLGLPSKPFPRPFPGGACKKKKKKKKKKRPAGAESLGGCAFLAALQKAV